MNKYQYSLTTMITMIVGIVIGAGIYFRADDILLYTNGNLILGLLVIILGALCIIFGSLTLAQLSTLSNNNFGMISFYQNFISEKIACGFGWFQLFVYFPTINAVVAFVCAIFTYMFLEINVSFEIQIITGFAYFIFFLLINTFSKKIGAYIQNISTFTKLIPLIIVALLGILKTRNLVPYEYSLSNFNFSFLAALVPIAYSYDGWMISLNIAPEVRNPEKNISRSLIIGPIIIVITYAMFFYGLNMLLSPDLIIKYGDGSIFQATKLINESFASAVLGIILISILGALNGLTLGAIRMPMLLVKNSYLPNYFKKIENNKDISLQTSLFYCLLVTFWLVVHCLVSKLQLLNGRDVSEISIVFSYVIYIILYVKAIQLAIKKRESKLKIIVPVFAIIGSLIILIGSLMINWLYVVLFLSFSGLIMFLGILYCEKKIKKL